MNTKTALEYSRLFYMNAEKLRIINNWSKIGLDIKNNVILNKDTSEENKDLWKDEKFNP